MTNRCFAPVAAVLACWVSIANAGNLSKVDRTIAKEPVYKSKKPQYCLLVFGPAAKTRVWVVRDGDDLYVDRNGNGNLSDPGEKSAADGRDFRPFEIVDAASRDRYRVAAIHVMDLKEGALLHADVQILGKFTQYGGGFMKSRAQEAAIAHFNGPLKMAPYEANGVALDKLAVGPSPRELSVLIGTIDKASGGWVAVYNRVDEKGTNKPEDFPTDIHPIANIEFPGVRPGEKPIVQRFKLSQRC